MSNAPREEEPLPDLKFTIKPPETCTGELAITTPHGTVVRQVANVNDILPPGAATDNASGANNSAIGCRTGTGVTDSANSEKPDKVHMD